jgi:hypothetical protein
MDLSPDLISACLALEKYLENPNALTERELVRGTPGHILTPHPLRVTLHLQEVDLDTKPVAWWWVGPEWVGVSPRIVVGSLLF